VKISALASENLTNISHNLETAQEVSIEKLVSDKLDRLSDDKAAVLS